VTANESRDVVVLIAVVGSDLHEHGLWVGGGEGPQKRLARGRRLPLGVQAGGYGGDPPTDRRGTERHPEDRTETTAIIRRFAGW
jgi:hypothetical protein